MENFTYLGHTFEPIGWLPETDNSLESISKHLSGRFADLCNYDGGEWDYKECYEAAKVVGADEMDIFYLDRKPYGSDSLVAVIPCQNQLFIYKGDYISIRERELIEERAFRAQAIKDFTIELNKVSPTWTPLESDRDYGVNFTLLHSCDLCKDDVAVPCIRKVRFRTAYQKSLQNKWYIRVEGDSAIEKFIYNRPNGDFEAGISQKKTPERIVKELYSRLSETFATSYTKAVEHYNRSNEREVERQKVADQIIYTCAQYMPNKDLERAKELRTVSFYQDWIDNDPQPNMKAELEHNNTVKITLNFLPVDIAQDVLEAFFRTVAKGQWKDDLGREYFEKAVEQAHSKT